jgi:hypothetical protein
MESVVTLCLVIVGLINFAPILGVVSGERLARLYTIELADKNMIILMRHRALLFGVIGGVILYAAFVPAYQLVAMVMAAISMIGYVILVLQVGGYNRAIFKVMVVDIVGIVFLVAAAVADNVF